MRCHEPRSSPAKAGAQERAALHRSRNKERPDGLLDPGLRRGTKMKQLNVFPLIAMLIVVIAILYWMNS